MDRGSQIHGWLASRPARFFKKKAAGRVGWIDPGSPPFFFNLAGWPANHVFGSTHPFWGYFYWYWYIIGCIFPIMGGIFFIMGGIFPIMAGSTTRMALDSMGFQVAQ